MSENASPLKAYKLELSVIDDFASELVEEAYATCAELKTSAPLVLQFKDNRVSLLNKEAPAQGGVCVALEDGVMKHRRLFGGGRQSEAVARAVLGRMESPLVFDATAGLARDAFICALFGARVHLFERNPCVRILLKDGLRRARNHTDVADIAERLVLEEERTIFSYSGELRPDTVYMDPMYPSRTKSASVKKEMAIFHFLVGNDLDISELWQRATELALKRVVMKNPKWAPRIGTRGLSGAVETKNHRFDIYVP